MTTKNGRYVGCINTFDKTLDGRPQKLRIKADWTGGDGRKSGNINQLRRIQKRDGYAYQTKFCKHTEKTNWTATQMTLDSLF
jgi:hypothetical protein